MHTNVTDTLPETFANWHIEKEMVFKKQKKENTTSFKGVWGQLHIY